MGLDSAYANHIKKEMEVTRKSVIFRLETAGVQRGLEKLAI